MTSCNIRSKKWIFGERYTTSGHTPDKNKFTAITKIPAPTNKKQVQSFIGWSTTCQNFLPDFQRLWSPFGSFQRTKYLSTGAQNINYAFTQIKQEIVSTPILAYYNPNKQTVLHTDTGIKGLGACLLQEEKPVYFASNALTEAQWGYVAIELESLAVAWAMEKFLYFLYASHFILETDQKPIEAICLKASMKLHQGYKESW